MDGELLRNCVWERKKAKRLVNERHLGFAAKMNVDIRHALRQGAEYLFLTHHDTYLAADMLTFLMNATRLHDAELAAPAIYYAEPPERIWSLGGWRSSTEQLWGLWAIEQWHRKSGSCFVGWFVI